MGETLLRVSDGLSRIVIGVGKLAAWLAIPIIVVILFDVITRRFLVLGSTKLQELQWHLHGILFLLCLGFAYLKDAHVRIELLRDRLDIRTRAWIEILGVLLCVFPYCGLMLWYGYGFAERSFLQNEGSSALTGLPHRWIIKSVVPIGFAFLLLSGLSVMLRCLVFLFGPPHTREEAGAFVAPYDPVAHEAAAHQPVTHQPGN